MKIQQPSDNSLYVTIGNYVYYFDDSIDGEAIVKRWHKADDLDEDPVFQAHLQHMESETFADRFYIK